MVRHGQRDHLHQGRAMRRAQILEAMVLLVSERGFAHTTVAEVCTAAKVSRRTFYEHFAGLEECLLAVMDDANYRVRSVVSGAFDEEQRWQDGVRRAVASLLLLFECEPRLARVCFVETLAAGSWALERRARHIMQLVSMIVERWPIPNDLHVDAFAAAAVMEALLGIIHKRLLTEREQPLVSLLTPLMGLISAIYLDPRSAEEEVRRAEAFAGELRIARDLVPDLLPHGSAVPAALRDPRAHRARACLRYLAGHDGASNMQIAAGIEVARPEQISRLLTRLSGMGLLVKSSGSPGRPNAWSLSSGGAAVTRSLTQTNAMPVPPDLI